MEGEVILKKMNGKNIDLELEWLEGEEISIGLASQVGKACDTYFKRKGMHMPTLREQISASMREHFEKKERAKNATK